MELVLVETVEHLDQIRQLFRDYYDWVQDFTQISLNFQSHLAELAGLPGLYQPPRGRLALANVEEKAVGCVALKPLTDTACEIKRMFIRPEFQGQGIGRKLALFMIEEARKAGYRVVHLDTADVLKPAQALYESLGFQRCQPYYDPPPDLAPRILFYKLFLQ